jgi:hypothetical protein
MGVATSIATMTRIANNGGKYSKQFASRAFVFIFYLQDWENTKIN